MPASSITPDSTALRGLTILITRAAGKAATLESELERRGATVVVMPTIQTADPPEPHLLQQAARDLGHYDWTIFTSATAVERFGAALEAAGNLQALESSKTAVIGKATARSLGQFGIRPAVVAEPARAEGLLAALETVPLSGKRVLLPRAARAREILPEGLRQRGAVVDVVVAYQTVMPPEDVTAPGLGALRGYGIDVVMFTSGSTAANFSALLGDERTHLLRHVVLASIGPVTTTACGKHNLQIDIEAQEATVLGLVEAATRYYAGATSSTRP